MDGTNYFQNALSNFVTDAACGGAVRHLTDSGYTLNQIVGRLDYPASRAKVQRIMMEYLYESHMLLREEPSEGLFAAKEQFVQVQDAYGRRSMRKVNADCDSQSNMTNMPDLTMLSQGERTPQIQGFLWKESVYDSRRDGKLTELLHKKCEKYGETYSYISCPFGEMLTAAEEKLGCLNSRQREYITGIRWEQPTIYHRLNRRMLEIISKLYETGAYDGACFFVTGREKITIPAR